ncbi:hypothetical protein P9761_03735 [Brevibacillus centrosporus]|uniref:hypothetical protein n=1 Tax=Brevibacillus centrosporus TaxID=54910 RepID=UPI002E2053F8|nr:hypothetical protein [Brevibacillus centrosporus]
MFPDNAQSAGSEEVVAQFSSIAHIASEVSGQTQHVHEAATVLTANTLGMRQAIQQVNV